MSWKAKGAPGCSKCRYVGCRTCFERSNGGTIALSSAKPNAKPMISAKPKAQPATAINSKTSPAEVATNTIAVDHQRNPLRKRRELSPVPAGFETEDMASDVQEQAEPKPKKRRGHSQEVVEANDTIDRLLQEAQTDYQGRGGKHPFDRNNTLTDAKKKWGHLKLLKLLQTKLCSACDEKLGMYFARENYMGGIAMAHCSTCFHEVSDNNIADWTASQAEKGLRAKGLSKYIKEHGQPVEGEAKAGTQVYSIKTVCEAAVEQHGGIWEMHYDFAKFENRRKQSDL